MLPFYSPNYQPYIYHYNFVISAASYKWSHIPCHFCSWLFLLSIMPLFIVILQRWNGHLMQHLVWMSTFDLDATHSPRGYGNVYCSQNVAFWWKQNILPIRYKNVLKKSRGQLSLVYYDQGVGLWWGLLDAAQGFQFCIPNCILSGCRIIW